MSSISLPEVNLEALQLIGRVYYKGTNANHDPFDAVFTVLLDTGHARLLAAHGIINFRAYKEIARQLYENYCVETCEVERHGKPEIWDIKKFMTRLKPSPESSRKPTVDMLKTRPEGPGSLSEE